MEDPVASQLPNVILFFVINQVCRRDGRDGFQKTIGQVSCKGERIDVCLLYLVISYYKPTLSYFFILNACIHLIVLIWIKLIFPNCYSDSDSKGDGRRESSALARRRRRNERRSTGIVSYDNKDVSY